MYLYTSIKIIGDFDNRIADSFYLFYVMPAKFSSYFKNLIGIGEKDVAVVDLESFKKGYIYTGYLYFTTYDKRLKPRHYNFLNLELEDVFKKGDDGELIIYRKGSIIYIEPKEDLEGNIVIAKINPYQRKPLSRETLNKIQQALYEVVKLKLLKP